MGALAVVQERPFARASRVQPIDIATAPTLAEIAGTISDMPASFFDECEARINGELIDRKYWHCVRPKYAHDTVVSFTLPLGGGGGGGGGGQRKNPIALVATIAVLLVAAAISGGALGPAGFGLLGASFAAGTIGASVLGAAVGLGGTLAIAALSPPPSLGAATTGSAGGAKTGIDTKQPAALNGNVLGKGQPIPRVCGTMRLFPPLACQPLVEIVGKDQTVEAVCVLSGPHAITNPRIGPSATSSMANVTTQIGEGLPSSTAPTLVQRYGYSDTTIAGSLDRHDLSGNDGETLNDQSTPNNSLPQWMTLTSRVGGPDEIWIPLAVPGGLARSDAADAFVPIRVRMRQFGSGGSWINLPEVHLVLSKTSQFFCTIKLMFNGTNAQIPFGAVGGLVRAFYNVPGQTASPGMGGWTADSYFSTGSGDAWMDSANYNTTTELRRIALREDRIEYDLSHDGSKFPQSAQWEIQIQRGANAKNSDFDKTDYSYSGATIYDFFGYQLVSSTCKVSFSDQRKCADDIQIPRISSVWNTNPIPDPTAVAYVAIKATNQSVQDFSVEASGYVNDWDGNNWANRTTTSNPVPHFRDVLGGVLGGYPVPADIIDDDVLVDWRQNCIDNSYEANVVLEGKTYIDALTILAAAGYARPTHNEKWGVMMDKDRSSETPRQIFTPRNMKEFSWRKAFQKLPTGIRAVFNDSTINYQRNEIIVYDDPDNPDSDQLEQISYDAYVTAAEVSARAAFDLLQAKKRLTFYTGTADMEAIVCTRGDLVGVQHDTLFSQAGAARIVSISRSAGNITGLTLDGTVPVLTEDGLFSVPHLFEIDHLFDLGASTGLSIRLKDGSGVTTKEITAESNGDETAVTFATPFADPGADKIDAGCLVTVGRLGSEYKRLIVYAIVPNDDLTATMTFVDEAPELWS